MSAFVVDQEHLNVLIWAGLSSRFGSPTRRVLSWPIPDPTAYPDSVETGPGYHYRRLTRDTAEIVGQILLDQNLRSVNYLYTDDEINIYLHRAPQHTTWTAVEILSAIACYEYQACETTDWPQTEAYNICQALQEHMIASLPAYSEAPWEITRSTLPAQAADRA